jgi:hypothetical protein
MASFLNLLTLGEEKREAQVAKQSFCNNLPDQTSYTKQRCHRNPPWSPLACPGVLRKAVGFGMMFWQSDCESLCRCQ